MLFGFYLFFLKNLLQHNVTNRSSKKFLTLDTDWLFVLEKINELNSDNDIKLLEFGAGRNLAQNIYLALSNKKLRQSVVDQSNVKRKTNVTSILSNW